MSGVRPWLDLIKIRITIAATTTTAVGFLLFRGEGALSMIPALSGIFLQACGAAVLNHVQEARLDLEMQRTATRPIPAGRISRGRALVVSVFLLVAGTALLWLVSWQAALLGLLAAVVYNGIYTPLKRISPFAAIPGSLIGAIPPVAGWVAAGGHPLDPTIHQVAFFFFLWQIPHFWLLLLFYETDYASSRLPSLFERFDRRQIARVTFTWIAAVAVAALVLPMAHTLRHLVTAMLIASAGFVLVLRARALLRDSGALGRAAAGGAAPTDQGYLSSCRKRFLEINVFALFVMVTLVVDRVV